MRGLEPTERIGAPSSGPPSGRGEPTPQPRRTPRVSIGIPVHNGEAFLAQALDSVAAQTWTDYELILCDNASTDRTQDICLARAAADPRVRYHRNPVNIGGDRNHNLCFELSSGEYFLGLASDDRLAPSYVEKAVRALDADPAVVFCHSRARIIDERGEPTGRGSAHAFSQSAAPHERLRDAICGGVDIVVGFGMHRASALAKTPLFQPYPSSDAFLQAELALLGRLEEIPEVLFDRRIHGGTGHAIPMHERLAWSAPERRGQLAFPAWRRLREYFRAIRRVPMSASERLRCAGVVAEFWKDRRVGTQLLRDLRMAARQVVLRTALGRKLRGAR